MNSAQKLTSCNHSNTKRTMQITNDIPHMKRALQLAERGLCSTSPNPRVGCVLVDADNQIIAEGWHQKAGEAHAEIHALQQASERAHGATAYVTLEPCSHHGKTGPCCEALIHAGVSRVVHGMQDPNPQVAGRGLQKLRDAGIAVDGPLLEKEARALNAGFIKRMQTGLPFVRVKMAMSLDGRTAMASGESQWITGATAREDVQFLRARSCAIITSADTVLHDAARLTVRNIDALQQLNNRQPLRVLLDQRARVALDSAFFTDTAPVLWCTHQKPIATLPAHVTHCALPLKNNQLDLHALLAELGSKQCNEVLIEAGATLAGAFVKENLVDELIIYIAPQLMGSSARPLLELPIASMSDAKKLHIVDACAIGDDWRFILRPQQSH
jgi:diaminohydroxyphosphoribosylaminopyrimidine deaminase/5-amino-6-(5-phosphoribosylamino)uracil reductase